MSGLQSSAFLQALYFSFRDEVTFTIKNRGGRKAVGSGPPLWLGCGEWWVEELVKNIIAYM